MWFAILSFLNYAGMITNALILGLTSQYGSKYKTKTVNVQLPVNTTLFDGVTNTTMTSFPVTLDSNNNLWIVLIFQVSVLLLTLLNHINSMLMSFVLVVSIIKYNSL